MRYLLCGASGAMGEYFLSQLAERGQTVHCLGLMEYDFTTEEGIAKALAHVRTVKEYDAIVWNAGTTSISELADGGACWPEFEKVMRCNVIAAYAVAREAFLASQRAGPRQFIGVFVGSEAARQALRHSHGYCASKAALESVCRSLARELAKHGARFFTVSPGPVEGTGLQKVAEEFLYKHTKMSRGDARTYMRANPMNRGCSIEEVWKVLDFCLHAAPEAMSGTTLRLPLGQGNI